MNSKIKTLEWIILTIATILLDIVQVILTFDVIGLVLNRIIDFIVGLCLPAYFWFRGISMKNPKNIASMLSGFLLEEFGLGGDDGLPLWTLEVILVWIITIGEKKASQTPLLGTVMKVTSKVNQLANTPLNANGVRFPKSETQPLNKSGVRLPPVNDTI